MENDNPFALQGRRIDPAELETALLDLGVLKEAVVVVRNARFGGPRLAAYVVPLTQPAPTPSELRAALERRLPDCEVPSAFLVMDALPRDPAGAVDRAALPAPYAARPTLGKAYKPPADPLEQLLTEVWEDCLNVRPIGVEDPFFELGGDSLLAAQMLIAVEDLVGKNLPPEVLLTGSTVRRLAGEILRPLGTETPGPLVQVQAGEPGRRLFFLHGDFTGGGLYCVNLARGLGSEQGFYALAPHGPEGRPMPQTIEAMAADLLPTLLAFQAQGPYVLGGHCNGALVALEMAHQLRDRGQQVEVVLLIAPTRQTPGQSLDSLPYVVPGPLSSGARPPRLDLSQLTPEDRRRSLYEIYRRACRRYQLRPYPGRLSAIEPQAEMERGGPKVNWRQVAPVVDLAVVPGNHFTMLTKHVQELAAVMRAILARVRNSDAAT